MTKLSRKPLPKDFGYYVNNLWSAFTLLDSKADIRMFFKDLFTHTEYKMFAKRLEIARRLLSDQTYETIRKDLSVTDATTSSISNVLAEGGEGFRKAHAKLYAVEEKRIHAERKRTSRVSNSVMSKVHRETPLAKLAIAGVRKLNKKFRASSKRRSAQKSYSI